MSMPTQSRCGANRASLLLAKKAAAGGGRNWGYISRHGSGGGDVNVLLSLRSEIVRDITERCWMGR